MTDNFMKALCLKRWSLSAAVDQCLLPRMVEELISVLPFYFSGIVFGLFVRIVKTENLADRKSVV